ncbi:uncharacterized protein [Temnothorax nylanderi]|uniref:uncharacterized protein isoform X2 n=1 Tax=Temnothorax nylanderi TaxID=102681 RepID=UPI003A85568C
MYESISEDTERLVQENLTAREQDQQDAAGTVKNEMLENFDSIMGEDFDYTENSTDNPAPSPMEVKPEICHDKVSDEVSKEVSKYETPNSSMENTSAEVINVPSDSDDDRDYYYCSTSDLNDVLIIDTVRANDTATSSSFSPLPGEIFVEPSVNLQDQVPAVASSSDRQATSVSNKVQDGAIAEVEENNNDVTYTKTVPRIKRLSESPRPGCSKDSDDIFLKPVDDSSNLDELLKDARLIHALLPRFNYRLIYRMLCSNQLARNRTELTLWDLLPMERPAPQYFRKRKSSDEICIVECKKSSNVSLQKDRVNTETAVEKKEQHVKSMVVENVEKLENQFASFRGEIEEMKKNVPEAAVSNYTNNLIAGPIAIPLKKVFNVEKLENPFASFRGEIEEMKKNVPETVVSHDTNNLIAGPNAIPMKKVFSVEKLENPFASFMREIEEMKKNVPETVVSHDMNNLIAEPVAIPLKKVTLKSLKLDSVAAKCVETIDDINKDADNLMHMIAQDLKKSPTIGPETKELNKFSEIKRKSKSLPDNKTTCPVAPVLQPAKLTLETNFQQSSQNVEMHSKSAVPILSPPKLRLITENLYKIPTISNVISSPILAPKSAVQMNHYRLNANFDPSANSSPIIRLPNTSSSNKEASRSSHSSHVLTPPIIICPNRLAPRNVLNVSRNMERKDAPLASIFTANVSQYYNQPSSSAETAQNVPDRQRANSSKACYNFDQEAGNASTSQDHARGDEKQQAMRMSVNYGLTTASHSEALDRIPSVTDHEVQQKDASKDADYKEVKPCERKEKHIEKSAESKNIILNEKASALYVKLIPMFPSVKTHYIKKLCHDYTRDYEHSLTAAGLFEHLVDMLLNCGQENLKKLKPFPAPKEEPDPSYDMNEQYADLLTIFPDADPVYLRKIAEELYGDHERIKEFVQTKIENPDYPTRTQYLAKKKITEQQKQYTTDFKVQQFLEIFPNPFSYFENDKRNCHFNPHAIDFLKYYFSKLRVNTLVKAYSRYTNNLSLTAKALEALNPDMKTKRQSNKMVLTEDIPFLQECAFIQHKAELRKYLDEMKAKEEQEFNELKVKGQLFECQCCYDNECMPSKCSTCEEGHIFCNSCIVRSTDVVLGDGNTRVDCLLKCGCEFPISVLQRVLPPTKFSILLCKRQEAEVIAAGVEGLVSCPFCHFASIPPPEDKIFKCLNPECMKESCRLCKELNHIPLKCNEKKTESARLFLEEKMTEALVRKCYRCSRMFFKEEGCNKMTCICGAQMCYICDKPVIDYKHFQGQGAERSNLCPLWSDDRRMNAESVIKVCKETVKQIKEKDPKIDINVDALLPKLPPKARGPHDDIPNPVGV